LKASSTSSLFEAKGKIKFLTSTQFYEISFYLNHSMSYYPFYILYKVLFASWEMTDY